jgi:hypothetical protein
MESILLGLPSAGWNGTMWFVVGYYPQGLAGYTLQACVEIEAETGERQFIRLVDFLTPQGYDSFTMV